MRMRVLRLVEYEGDRDWVEKIISDSKHGTNTYPGGTIKAQTVSSFTTVSEKPKEESLKTPYCSLIIVLNVVIVLLG